MSTPTNPSFSTVRRVTAVPARRLKVRDIAPGVPYIDQVGPHQTIVLDGAPEGGVALPLLSRVRYAIKLRKLKVHHPKPIASRGSGSRAEKFPRFNRVARRLARKTGAAALAAIKLLPRMVAVAAITLLSLAGVSRFVHIDIVTVAKSIRFEMPHFLTPWRPPALDPALIRHSPALAPVVTGSASEAVGGGKVFVSGRAEESANEPALQSGTNTLPRVKADPSRWLPLPNGPLPLNMPTYGTKDPVRLAIHSPFSGGEAEGASDFEEGSTVQLLTKGIFSLTEQADQRKTPVEPSSQPTRRQSAHEESRPAQKAQPAPARSQTGPAQEVVTQPARRQSVDVVLLNQGAPGAQQRANREVPVDNFDGSDDFPPAKQMPDTGAEAPAAPAVNPPQKTGPARPSFVVVTKTDDSLVVMDQGKMKQIPVGQSLPDGSKLLGVSRNGGGFTTNRGSYVAY